MCDANIENISLTWNERKDKKNFKALFFAIAEAIFSIVLNPT